ncbi:MAG: sulfite exporter TauE/SafE family protein [Flammeovirgaceae bacterium]|nr:sulfite exporter TauE/SafE family protein [Flammeovirgaceae bacterium]
MYITALMLGLAGSLHCAGMCSPLVVAVHAKNPFLASKLFYNSGRVFMYSVLGLIVGFLAVCFNHSRYKMWYPLVLDCCLSFWA